MRKGTPVGNRLCRCGCKAFKWLGSEAVCNACSDKSNQKRQTLAKTYHRDRTK